MSNQGYIASRKFKQQFKFFSYIFSALYYFLLVVIITSLFNHTELLPYSRSIFFSVSLILGSLSIIGAFVPLPEVYDFSKLFPEEFKSEPLYKANSLREKLFTTKRGLLFLQILDGFSDALFRISLAFFFLHFVSASFLIACVIPKVIYNIFIAFEKNLVPQDLTIVFPELALDKPEPIRYGKNESFSSLSEALKEDINSNKNESN
jgi:hypothetical protein